jgi:hypothetical protein
MRFRRTDVADDRVANVKAEARLVGRPSLASEGFVQFVVLAQARQDGLAGMDGVVGVIGRRVPERHHRIAE